MSNKKQVFLSLETARKMWKTGHEPTQSFCLENFTEEELEAKELLKTWEELNKIDGYFINHLCEIKELSEQDNYIKEAKYFNKSVFPTKELAEASLALSQLLQLRDVYNGDWKVDLNNKPNEVRFVIQNHCNNICKNHLVSGFNNILSFQKESIRDEFAENFKDLITTALPLL